MKGKVYFVECAGAIKIGFSTNLEKRLLNLNTGAPAKLVLIGAIDGPQILEGAIHAHLDIFRTTGEWFMDCDAVRDTIRKLIELGPAAIDFEFKPRPIAKVDPLFKRAVRKLAEPMQFGDKTKLAIEKSSEKTGLSYWRTFDIWYGKARRVELPEAVMIHDALVRQFGT
jgi:hypothetical protein